jgi:hypothetical protein
MINDVIGRMLNNYERSLLVWGKILWRGHQYSPASQGKVLSGTAGFYETLVSLKKLENDDNMTPPIILYPF